MASDTKKRIWIGVVMIIVTWIGIYLYSQYNPEDTPFFPKCPVYSLTGYKCPGCGSQRAFHHFFQGDFSAAFRYNPLMLLLIPYILLGVYVEYIANRMNPRIVRFRAFFFGKWAALALAILILFYTIGRNVIPIFSPG